jgi:CubicO group peptidase (beta-lactamase class C family)
MPGRREPKTEYGSGPAGGFSATTADMGRFVKALLNDGCLDNVCILRPGTLAEMFKRQRPLAPHLTNSPNPSVSLWEPRSQVCSADHLSSSAGGIGWALAAAMACILTITSTVLFVTRRKLRAEISV